MSSHLRLMLAVGLALAAVAGARQITSGWFGFVTTRGVSMEPTYHAGDLVLIRGETSYEIGDIVAYRSGSLADEVVLHRIVEIDDGRVRTQGDNNGFVDDDNPALEDLQGRAILTIPRIGALMERVRPLLAGGAAALMVIPLATTRRRRGHPKHRIHRSGRNHPMSDLGVSAYRVARTTRQVACLLLLAGAALLATTLARDPQQVEEVRLEYQHSGAFEYHAASGSLAVYPDGSADTGEPIYRRLMDQLDVSFVYRLRSPADLADDGSARLEVEVGKGDWRRRVRTGEEVPVRGGAAHLEATLDLAELERAVAAMAAETGEAAVPFTVTVRPVVQIAGISTDDTFSPELTLQLDTIRAQVNTAQLEPSEPGSITTSTLADRPLRLGPVSMSNDAARWLAAAALGLGALAAGIAELLLRRRPAPESVRIRAAHASEVVTVSGVLLRDHVVDVTSIDALLKVAEHHGRLVLHADRDGDHWFVVDDGHTTFRYQAA